MKKFTLFVASLFILMMFHSDAYAVCNWKSKITNFYTWDSCTGNKASLNGYVALNTKGCFIYQWKVGSANVGTNYPVINSRITKNGTYTLCVKITDTCNKCDTTLCATFTISCLSTCNWKGRTPTFTAWDTCKGAGGRNSLNGYMSFNSSTSCFKYTWTVNGNIVGKNNKILNYPITGNGSYAVCVKVTDTCNQCDTTFCSTRTISCFSSGCSWKSKTNYYFWDTCKGSSGRNSLNAYVAIKTGSCYKYQWTVNSASAGNGTIMHFNIANNGTYNVCVKITDTCNKCDTTICSTRTITCFSGNCNWKKLSPSLVAWDTCHGSGQVNSITAYIGLNSRSCQKYVWSINGVAQSTKNYYIHYPVTANGTYVLCVKVTDTCNNCDTTFCTTRTFTCFPSCNWKSKISNFYAWDTCKGSSGRNSLNAYIAFKSSGCYKYQWSVNKALAGNGNIMHYNIFNNGTYTVCVKVTDTCNHCDTTICSTRSITCFSSNKCNFKARTPYFTAWDTCKGSGGANSVNAYMSFQSFYCLKYIWSVNGVPQTSIKSNIFHYPVKANGTYVICVKVIDSCGNCDTTICSTRSITCFPSCNWKSKISNFYAWDTCKGRGARNSVNAYIAFKSSGCYKYQWKVNSNLAGNGNIMHYNISANGTYNICVKVTDTCNHCDTIICATKTISCFSSCNFKGANPLFRTYDSCVGNKNYIGGYISFKNKPCFKYLWTVAGNAVSTNYYFADSVSKNGSYVICVKVTDTCNSQKCDTTFCITRTINCNSMGINNHISSNDNIITLYPNPVQNTLNIDWAGDKAKVEVVTLVGEIVYSGELTSDKKSIQTNTWSNGIYLVRVKTETSSKVFKIMVNR